VSRFTGIAIASTVVVTSVLAVATSATAFAPTTHHAAASTGSWDSSTIWAGYEQDGKEVNEVEATWTIPKKPEPIAGKDASAIEWIGVGGSTDTSPLVQVGTTWASLKGGSPKLSSFYEFLNGKTGEDKCCKAVPLGLADLGPGDEIAADLFEDSPTLWHFAVEDVTKETDVDFLATSCGKLDGPVVSEATISNVDCASFAIPGTSAEVIHERGVLKGSNEPSELFATAPVPFTDASFDGGPNDYSGPLATPVAGFKLLRVYMTKDTDDPQTNANTLAYPSTPMDGGESFNVIDGPAPAGS
jgi:Peptidase A4 family